MYQCKCTVLVFSFEFMTKASQRSITGISVAGCIKTPACLHIQSTQPRAQTHNRLQRCYPFINSWCPVRIGG